jgi:coenzyme PQQ precursor peptide PqqA
LPNIYEPTSLPVSADQGKYGKECKKVTPEVPGVEKGLETQQLARRVCRLLHCTAKRRPICAKRFYFSRVIASAARLGYSELDIHGPTWTAGGFMEWTAPAFEEVCLNCEINSYASAKL